MKTRKFLVEIPEASGVYNELIDKNIVSSANLRLIENDLILIQELGFEHTKFVKVTPFASSKDEPRS